VASDELRMRGVERTRRALEGIVREIHAHDQKALVALKHRPSTVALATGSEDFLYAEAGGLAPAELGSFVVALHNLAMARPVVIEFPPARASQDDLVAPASGVGAAGVVAPPPASPKPRQDGKDLLQARPLTAEETSAFISLNGTCPPHPARTPMVS